MRVLLRDLSSHHENFPEAFLTQITRHCGQRRRRILRRRVAYRTLEPESVIASPSTTPLKSLPLLTTTRCTGMGPSKIADAVQSGLTEYVPLSGTQSGVTGVPFITL